MARITPPLTDTQIKSAKPQDKEYTLQDGQGLYLLIKSTGSKIWRFNYYRPDTKKRALISFGSYPEISLQQARKKRDESRELIKQGIDPLEYKASEKQKELINKNNTLRKVANDWFKVKTSKGLAEDTLKKIWQSLENHILPYVGDVPITQITASQLINTLQPLRAKGNLDILKRITQRINEIMYYAINVGIISANPVAKISAAFESPERKNMLSIRPEELPELMNAISLARIEQQTRCLIEWQLLTMTRPAESVGVKWSEIDFKSKVWTIPAERMKMKREHIIPLSSQALAILDIMKPISGHREYVFPTMKAPYKKPMNSQTTNAAIKRAGFAGRLVAHGLRSLASTTLNEQGFAPDVIESALAHADSNEVRRAYNRSTYLEQRRIMMDWWGDFIEQACKGTVSLSGNRTFKIVNE